MASEGYEINPRDGIRFSARLQCTISSLVERQNAIVRGLSMQLVPKISVTRRPHPGRKLLCVWILSICLVSPPAAGIDAMHKRMLDEIADDFRRTAHLTGRSQMQPAVQHAMSSVRRHEFMATNATGAAYVNRPAMIGYGQTISQPFIVAIMTDLLDLQTHFRVLEIGTGFGYQAAVLAEIVDAVYSIEIVAPLAAAAAERLKHLGYDDIHLKVGDGNYGWPEAAPFDGIIITAGGRLPRALVDQLKPGGRLVVPINQSDGSQELMVYTKDLDGTLTQRSVLPVRFVPLTGDN